MDTMALSSTTAAFYTGDESSTSSDTVQSDQCMVVQDSCFFVTSTACDWEFTDHLRHV